ncbi:hypothetical protein LTR35_005989 [Friedmanniomyces endolithicus]|nr:hypothetical protein LTR35_005989 [Friedmanniomyces endolithicus]KAK0300779.1 hypothetical protein LTS00_001037 [Friedmanniomyces endolithicus]
MSASMNQPSDEETYNPRGRTPSRSRIPVAERRKIPVAERRKIPVAERRRIDVAERRKRPVAGRGEVPVPQLPEVPVTHQHQQSTAGCRSSPAMTYHHTLFTGFPQQRTSSGLLLAESGEEFSSGSTTPTSDGGGDARARYDALLAEQEELVDSGENVGRVEMARLHEAVLRARAALPRFPLAFHAASKGGAYGGTRLVITTRNPVSGFFTPVSGIIAGIFHVPDAGLISHRLTIAAPSTMIPLSANVRPLHIAAPVPHDRSLPYLGTVLPDSASVSKKRSGRNWSGSGYTNGALWFTELL